MSKRSSVYQVFDSDEEEYRETSNKRQNVNGNFTRATETEPDGIFIHSSSSDDDYYYNSGDELLDPIDSDFLYTDVTDVDDDTDVDDNIHDEQNNQKVILPSINDETSSFPSSSNSPANPIARIRCPNPDQYMNKCGQLFEEFDDLYQQRLDIENKYKGDEILRKIYLKKFEQKMKQDGKWKAYLKMHPDKWKSDPHLNKYDHCSDFKQSCFQALNTRSYY